MEHNKEGREMIGLLMGAVLGQRLGKRIGLAYGQRRADELAWQIAESCWQDGRPSSSQVHRAIQTGR